MTVRIVTLTTALIVLAPAAMADDVVIFENAIDPAIAQQMIAEPTPELLIETLFLDWQTARTLHSDAIAASADAEEIELLSAAADAAAEAYSEALVVQNTVQLASVEPVILTDEMFAELIPPVAE